MHAKYLLAGFVIVLACVWIPAGRSGEPIDAPTRTLTGGDANLLRLAKTLAADDNGYLYVFEKAEVELPGPDVAPFLKPIAAAVVRADKKSQAPYPPSPVIEGVEWAPPATIVRLASGSDNWPITWADDGHQYTAYGDGWGFAPKTKKKLSLGIAKIIGPPTHFRGVNVRTESGERVGQGPKGPKASGMLMVDGVLYMWARNTGNSRLAGSSDHGKTWAWSDWKFTTSLGYPTFLNFGKNYAGARDNYVYVYSHDADSAYTPADRMVLARVPKGRIRDRTGYTFFDRLDAHADPVWTKNINGRGEVFKNPGRCYRSGISYNPALRRYLWCQILPGDDTRYRGGFGIYDAPEPWGPWTTVYFTEKWDVGPGETCSLPTKWMSDDGTSLFLVFSGEDSFSVRRVTFTLSAEEAQRRGGPRNRSPKNSPSGQNKNAVNETSI